MTEDFRLTVPLPYPTTAATVDLAALVDTYSALLFRVAHAILRSQSEAEDVVQDVFVRVLEHQHKLPGVRDTRVWLVRIAWNLALDRKRRIRPEQMDDLAASQLAEAQQMGAVFNAIDRLPGAERQALLLCTLEELSTPEVAGIMGKSESAVRALVFRARERLRARLAGKGAGR